MFVANYLAKMPLERRPGILKKFERFFAISKQMDTLYNPDITLDQVYQLIGMATIRGIALKEVEDQLAYWEGRAIPPQIDEIKALKENCKKSLDTLIRLAKTLLYKKEKEAS